MEELVWKPTPPETHSFAQRVCSIMHKRVWHLAQRCEKRAVALYKWHFKLVACSTSARTRAHSNSNSPRERDPERAIWSKIRRKYSICMPIHRFRHTLTGHARNATLYSCGNLCAARVDNGAVLVQENTSIIANASDWYALFNNIRAVKQLFAAYTRAET